MDHGLDCLAGRHSAVAQTRRPPLQKKRATPHALRYLAAMALVENGVSRAAIALAPGCKSVTTKWVNLRADLNGDYILRLRLHYHS